MAPRTSSQKPTPAEHRAHRGFALGEAAERADLSPPTLLKIESGDERVTVRAVLRLARSYGIRSARDLGDFFEGFIRAGTVS